jgi:hypothetical protein
MAEYYDSNPKAIPDRKPEEPVEVIPEPEVVYNETVSKRNK